MIVQIVSGAVPLTHIPLSKRENDILVHCLTSGQVWCGMIDGEVEACWGVIPPSYMSEEAYLWMWDLPVKHPLVLARHSRHVIQRLLEHWNLYGHCKYGTSSTRWLKWLGATFDEAHNDFVPFSIRRPTDG